MCLHLSSWQLSAQVRTAATIIIFIQLFIYLISIFWALFMFWVLGIQPANKRTDFCSLIVYMPRIDSSRCHFWYLNETGSWKRNETLTKHQMFQQLAFKTLVWTWSNQCVGHFSSASLCHDQNRNSRNNLFRPFSLSCLHLEFYLPTNSGSRKRHILEELAASAIQQAPRRLTLQTANNL